MQIMYLSNISSKLYIETITKKIFMVLNILNLKKIQKLILALVIFVFITKTKKVLKKIFCIYYLIYFQKSINNIKALINSGNNSNIITLIYTLKLGF